MLGRVNILANIDRYPKNTTASYLHGLNIRPISVFVWFYFQPRSSVSMNEWSKYETVAELSGKTWGKGGTQWD